MKKYISLYFVFFKLDIKRIFRYRSNIIASGIGYTIESVGDFFPIWLITRFSSTIGGWNGSQIFALFSYTLFLLTIWEFFFVNTLDIPDLINEGNLDVFLMRPINDIYQFMTMELDEESIFEIIISLVVTVFAILTAGTVLTWLKLGIFLMATLSAIMGIEAIYLAISSTAFWFKSADGLRTIVYQILELARYPLTIYPNFIIAFLSVLPFGLYGYYPLNILFFNSNHPLEIIYTIFSGPFYLFFSYFFIWKKGLKHYTSAAG